MVYKPSIYCIGKVWLLEAGGKGDKISEKAMILGGSKTSIPVLTIVAKSHTLSVGLTHQTDTSCLAKNPYVHEIVIFALFLTCSLLKFTM